MNTVNGIRHHTSTFPSDVKNSEYKYSPFMATGTVYALCFWQSNRHTESWTSTDLCRYTFPLHLPFLPPPRTFGEVLCGSENSPNFPLAETRLSAQTSPLAPSHSPHPWCRQLLPCYHSLQTERGLPGAIATTAILYEILKVSAEHPSSSKNVIMLLQNAMAFKSFSGLPG